MRQFVLVLMSISFWGAPLAWAYVTPSALQASNIMNPNVSVIGWFQGEAGRREPVGGQPQSPAFQFKEAELAFQAVVDPYARADFFVSAEDSGVSLEEGYITWFTLPYDLSLKVGRFRSNFGKFNRTHKGETPFADRPLVGQNFLGDEGLSGTGGSLSWQIPNPWLFVNLDAEVTTSPDAAASPAFDKAKTRDLLYIGRLSAFQDVTEATNVTFGASTAYGPAEQQFDPVQNSSNTLHTQLYGLDMTWRWKNPRRAIYRSLFWQTEALWSQKDVATQPTASSFGIFSHLEWQFAQRWRTGGRFDWTEFPTDGSRVQQGGLIYITFTPTEFSLISLQGREVHEPDGTVERLGFLKITFNIGPHGAHPF